MPVDCDVDGGHAPFAEGRIREDGQGVSHFVTCPGAAQFRRRA